MSDMATAAAIKRVDPIDVLALRAWARAYLWWAGEYELAEAVDVLQHDAARDGLVDELGQDAVQAIFADAFRPLKENRTNGGDVPEPSSLAAVLLFPSTSESGRGQPPFPNRVAPFAPPNTEPEQTKQRRTPQSTVEAIMYCVRERGIEALKEPDNIERLARCDAAAFQQINDRIEKLQKKERAHGLA